MSYLNFITSSIFTKAVVISALNSRKAVNLVLICFVIVYTLKAVAKAYTARSTVRTSWIFYYEFYYKDFCIRLHL